MATISTTLELVDRMSGRLTAIAGRVQALADRFLQLDGRIGSVQARLEALGTQDFQMNAPEIALPGIEKVEIPERVMAVERLAVPFVQQAVQTEMQVPAAEMLTPTVPEIMLSVPEMLAPTVPEIPGVRAEITAGISEDGTGFLSGIAEKIQSQRGMLASLAGEAANAAVAAVQRGMQPAVGAAIGMHFAEGLAQGIRSRISSVAAAARAVANAANSAARAALDIHSPSRAAEEIGAYFGAGFAEGINASGGAVSKAAGRLSGIAYRELDAQLWSGIRFFGELEQARYEPGAESVYLSERDAQRVRELAEREAVKTFTTAELNIAFTANNSIDSKMDLDGVVAYLEEQVAEKLALAAEGVYA